MAVEDVEEVDILEDPLDVDLPVDFLDIVDFRVVEVSPVDLPVSVEDLGVEDLVSIHHSAVRGAIVDIEEVIVEDTTEVATVDITEVMFRDITMEDTTTQEDITEAIIDTTIEAMPHTEQPSGFSLVG